MKADTTLEPDKNQPKLRRMHRPNAIAFIAVASTICWLVIIGVYLGVEPNANDVADDRDIQELIEFAPAAGPTQ